MPRKFGGNQACGHVLCHAFGVGIKGRSTTNLVTVGELINTMGNIQSTWANQRCGLTDGKVQCLVQKANVVSGCAGIWLSMHAVADGQDAVSVAVGAAATG